MDNSREIIEFGDPNIERTTFKWIVTNVCNYECSYCNAVPGQGELLKSNKLVPSNDQDAWKQVLNRLSIKKIGKFDIQLLGGEPTIHPNFNTIINDLVDNVNCKEIEVFTNLSRGRKFLSELVTTSGSKLRFIASYHPEYFSSGYVKKIVELNGVLNGCVIPTINLSCDRKHWDEILEMIKVFDDHKVHFRFNFLHDVKELNYKSQYTPEFWSTFHQVILDHPNSLTKIDIDRSPDEEKCKKTPCRDAYSGGIKIKAKYSDNTVDYLYDNIVSMNDQNRFKGWSCSTRIYNITVSGIFYNDCTKENLPALFTEKDLSKYRACPKEYCDRMCFVFYNKLNYHKRRDE